MYFFAELDEAGDDGDVGDVGVAGLEDLGNDTDSSGCSVRDSAGIIIEKRDRRWNAENASWLLSISAVDMRLPIAELWWSARTRDKSSAKQGTPKSEASVK